MVMAIITVKMLAPDNDTTAMASRIAGIAITPSMIRIKTASSQRKKPENRPITSPPATEMMVAPKPIRSEMRPP